VSPAAAVALALLAGAVTRGLAQSTATVDAGGTRVDYEGDTDVSAFSITPGLAVDGASTSLAGSGTFSRYDTGDWSIEGGVSGTVFTPSLLNFQGEIGAAAQGSAQPGTVGTGEFSGEARLHWLAGDGGVWVGGDLGRATDGEAWRTVRGAELGSWGRFNAITLIGRVTPTWIGDSIRYTDAQAIARLEQGRLEVDAYVGLRDWSRPDATSASGWGGVSAALWLSEHLAVLGGGGKYPADFAQGFPGGSYATLGFRLATRRPGTRQALARTAPEALPPIAQPVTGGFRVRPAGAGHWQIQVHAPQARLVEVMGDFTDWRAVPLQPAGNQNWTLTLPIVTGTHRMNLRVDGGGWGVPRDLPVLTDEFSGVVALLTIQ